MMALRCTDPQCVSVRRALEEELRRIKSASYDLLKQQGDWQSGGKTHEEHCMTFDAFFHNEVEEMAEHLQKTADMSENEARELLCQTFQSIYSNCRERVLNRMRDTLSRVVGVVPGQVHATGRDGEALHDACRAYGLLLHSSKLKEAPLHQEASSQIHTELLRTKQSLQAAENELSQFTKRIAEMSWDLLCTVPPLVCAQPRQYRREYHYREANPLWNKTLRHYELVYYRPILFLSHRGSVGREGWVGNRKREEREGEEEREGSEGSMMTTPPGRKEEEELTIPWGSGGQRLVSDDGGGECGGGRKRREEEEEGEDRGSEGKGGEEGKQRLSCGEKKQEGKEEEEVEVGVEEEEAVVISSYDQEMSMTSSAAMTTGSALGELLQAAEREREEAKRRREEREQEEEEEEEREGEEANFEPLTLLRLTNR